ncbi:MAG TPA: phosphoribosylglycinamide formyltransferase [Coriobacteriia bacterium]|jgi:phosphoribosylglycinamide formyltransferase-1
MPDVTAPPPNSLIDDAGKRRLRLGVLISGSGTNLQAIIDASAAGTLDADVAVVVSDKDAAYGLVRARNAGIPDVYLCRSSFEDITGYNRELARILLEHEVGLVVMAGYMRLLGRRVLEAFPGRVMNIHPALLPSFPGAAGVADAFAYGVKVTGVTVHFADESFDNGPIIAQEPVVIEETDDVESLEARIHEVEHRIYPRAIQLFAENRLVIEGRKVRILPRRS